MRVLLLTTNFHPVVGGAESYCRELAIGLARLGHDVTVFTDGGAGSAPQNGIERGVTVIRDRSYRQDLTTPDKSAWEQMAFGLLPALARSVRVDQVDVVHANSQDTAILGSIVKLHHGIPLVVTSHEVQRDREPLGAGRCRLVFAHLPVDAHIAVSDCYRRAAEGFGARHVHHIPLGVDRDRFFPGDRTVARRRLGIADDAFVLTCIARIKPRKGLLELVDAAATLRTVLPQLQVLLAGTTSSGSQAYAAQVRARIVETGLAGRVRVVDDFGHDQVPVLLHATDVYAQPSYTEGLGLATVEAMACGVPVVATDTDGLREAVEPDVSGLLVPVGEPGPLADAVLRLAHDRDLRDRLIRGGLARVREQFSLATMVAQTEALYRRVITGLDGLSGLEAAESALALTAGRG